MNKCDLTLTICVFFQHDYQHKGPVYRFLRKVMALPFLPWEQIETAFEALNDQVTTPKIARFMKYVQKKLDYTQDLHSENLECVQDVSQDKQW